MILHDGVSVTISANKPEYVFQIAVDAYGLNRLRFDTFLGYDFPKNKYRFLKDLSDALSEEILRELTKIMEQSE